MKSLNKLEKEIKINDVFIFIILMLVLTGVINSILPGNHHASQLLSIAHIVSSCIFIPLSAYYTVIHFNRTLGIRNFLIVLTGVFLSLLIISIIITGAYLVFAFNSSQNKIWLNTHIVSSTLFVIITITHIYLKWSSKKTKTKTFNSINLNNQKKSLFITVLILIALMVLGIISEKNFLQIYNNNPSIKDYKYNYGKNPFSPSFATTNVGFINKNLLGNSQECASCHTDIYKQWKSSVHKHASSDPAYVKNLNLLQSLQGIEATRYCEGCHSPLTLLSGQLSDGGQHSATEGTDGFNEGISCLACHTIERANNLKGNASYHIQQYKADILFPTENIFSKILHDLAIRLDSEEHKKQLNNAFIKSSEFCATCHVQFMDKDVNTWGWIQMQDEYNSWLSSPYSGANIQSSTHTKRTDCQSCHMPLVSSTDPAAKDGLIRSHDFSTANTFVPLMTNDKLQLERINDFMKSEKVLISLVLPERKDITQNQNSLDESIRNTTEQPFFAYLGEEVQLKIIVHNKGVGHDFPGGTTDLSEAWIELLVVDAENNTVFHSGYLEEDNAISDNSVVYKSIPINRKGNEVWRHDLFFMVGESYNHAIKAGSSDIETFKFKVPYDTVGDLRVYASINYRKLNTKYISWVLGKENYNPLPIIKLDTELVNIPVFESPRASDSKELHN